LNWKNPASCFRLAGTCDSGCEPNPDPGGYGVVLVHPNKRAKASVGFRLTNDNRLGNPSRHQGSRIIEAGVQGYAFQRFAVFGGSTVSVTPRTPPHLNTTDPNCPPKIKLLCLLVPMEGVEPTHL
jgi:hypothetical protein